MAQIACSLHNRVFILDSVPDVYDCPCCDARGEKRLFDQCNCNLVEGNIPDKYNDLETCAKALREIDKTGHVTFNSPREEAFLHEAAVILYLARCIKEPRLDNNSITETGRLFLQGDVNVMKNVLRQRNRRV